MATTTALSAVVVKKERRSFAPSFVKTAPCSRCYRNGPSCSILQHQHVQNDADSPRRLSRRDAVALVLQAVLLSAPNTNAQATESAVERAKGAEHVQAEEELGIRVLVGVSSVPELRPKLLFGKLVGCMLAYQGEQKNSGSSLGFLGCLVFGLLFLKEKQTRATNNTALEDVQIRIKQAETELRSQTRSSVRYKMEESQLENGSGRNTLLYEALQHQLVHAKFSIVEKGKQLDMKKDVSEMLKKQATSLAFSIKEIEKICSSLLEQVDKQLKSQHELDTELQSVVRGLQCKARKVSSLEASVDSQEEANNETVEKLQVVERDLEKANKHVLDAEKAVKSLRSKLLATDDSAESLSKELTYTNKRNKTLEGESNEVFRNLQCEQAAFGVQLAKHKDLLSLRQKDIERWSVEFLSEQEKLERNSKTVDQLTYQRDELLTAISKKNGIFDGLKDMLALNQERLRSSQNDLATLHEQLLHEQACRTVLEADLKNNGVLGPLSKGVLEVENKIQTQKGMTERLETELQTTSQALRESKGEISALQNTMQSLLSSQAQLQIDITRRKEERQAVSQALKKEKRAAAYAKKQLALSKELMSEESRVMEELCADLEKARRLISDSKEQILAKASELESVLHLKDDVSLSKSALSALNKEQGLKVNIGRSDEVLMSVGKPIRRRNTTKQAATPKTQKRSKNSSVQSSV